MKTLIMPLAGITVLAAAGAAQAAPPAYCALYAREYANQFTSAAGQKQGAEQSIQDEAYYRCLNQDQDPQLPTTSAYYGTTVDTAGQGGAPKPATGSDAPAGGKTADTMTAAAPQAPAEASQGPATQTADSTPPRHSYTGGKKPWTPEWFAACKKYFPNSFNEKDGTILPHGASKRQLCR